MNLAILDDYQGVALDLADWGDLDIPVTVFREPFPDADAVVAKLREFEIICAMRERTPFPAELFPRLPKLKLLVTTGMKNASIDVAAANARGVTVCGTESPGHATGELTMALMLSLARGLPQETASLRSGGWQVGLGRDLRGATLGLIGLGRLGARVAKMAQVFGMEAIAWSENLTDERCTEVGVRRAASLDALLGEADFVTIHTRLSDRTRGLLGARELGLMKRDAALINTSRGPIVDMAALLKALDAGRPGSAAVDVYDTEPLPRDCPERNHPKLLATPHVGYVTRETYRIFYEQSCEAVAAWQLGVPIRVLS